MFKKAGVVIKVSETIIDPCLTFGIWLKLRVEELDQKLMSSSSRSARTRKPGDVLHPVLLQEHGVSRSIFHFKCTCPSDLLCSSDVFHA